MPATVRWAPAPGSHHGVKVLVGTDRSPSADVAAAWGADMARRFEGELLLVQVLSPQDAGDGVAADRVRVADAQASFVEAAQRLAGPRAQARVIVGEDPAAALVDAVERERAHVVVVGNVGMAAGNGSSSPTSRTVSRTSRAARSSSSTQDRAGPKTSVRPSRSTGTSPS